MKKIIIFALHLGYGGIEQYISSLCKMLEDDHKIEIICTYKILEKPAFEFSDKISIKYLLDFKPNRNTFNNYLKKFKLISAFKEGLKSLYILYKKLNKNIKAIKNIDTDYVITTRIFHNKLVSKYADKNVIKIATDHNHHDNNQNYINKVVKSCRKFDYFIAISKSLYETYKCFMNKCIYIPNVIDNVSSKSSNLNKKSIISIGRLSKEKGLIDLIIVVNLIKEVVPDIKLHLIGDGVEKDNINSEIKKLGLESNVILHGFLNKKEIEKHMLDSSLYVMTSYTESFGLVLLESFSYGIPAIAFDSALGAKELINSHNGILISNRNKENMAKEIINLLNDNSRIKELAKNAKEKSKEYLADNVKTKWLNILK